MAIRVLWVTKGLGPGGAEFLLVAAARAHDRERFAFECAYVLPGKDHLVGDLERSGVLTQCLSRRRQDLWWPWRLVRLVRRGGWDVVHVHAPLPGSVARMAARTMRRSRRPMLVTTEHNRWETHRLPTHLANRVTIRWDDATLAVTDEVRESMKGRAGRRARTVRHGIDVDGVAATSTAEKRTALREELGLTPDEVVVGTVANFRPQKDYPNLLAAARLLADRDVPVRIVAVGQGPLELAVRTQRDQLGLDGRVILTGFRADAREVMAACDVFTLASQWEGLPVAIMEALALGLPIVATNVGGMAEELHDGQDALLVPAKDPEALAEALERVVADADLRARLGAAARLRAADFDVSRAVTEIEAIYAARSLSLGSGEPAPPPAASPPPPPPPPPAKRGGDRAGAGFGVRAAVAEDREAILSLLARSLGADGDDPRYGTLFSWKHDDNPFGPSPMWVATDADRIVAFRTFMRWEFVRSGTVIRAVRAVDTATDPDYQGRGLFTLLTRHALEAMRANGVDWVFNTPNDQSRPGYLKMGWVEVGRLPAALRVTGPRSGLRAIRSKVPADRWSQELSIGEEVPAWLARIGEGAIDLTPCDATDDVRQVRTHVTPSFLAWRYGTPLLHYRVIHDDETSVIVRARRRGQATELVLACGFGRPGDVDRLAATMARRAGADYVIRLGRWRPGRGFAPLPGGGPVLTWREVCDAGRPALANWALTLGDIELF